MTVTLTVPDAAAMRDLGRQIAAALRGGDLVLLIGPVGAGKTTLTQGIGAGLGVRGQVASPTFIISRVHPALGDGPDLVHVDAYRLNGLDELDALDLDTSLENSVTVVEWGEGLVEVLSDSWLEVQIERPVGDLPDDLDTADVGDRYVRLIGVGERWADLDLEVSAQEKDR
jgi:tRNA threonylcarbamoyladenosine biosynthesis protein TsaE